MILASFQVRCDWCHHCCSPAGLEGYVHVERWDAAMAAVLAVPAVAEVFARDAKVREIVDTERPAGFTTYVWAGERHRRIAALYPSPGDRDDSEEQK